MTRLRPDPAITVGLLAAVSLASYVVRSNVSVAGKLMMADLRLDAVQMGQVFAAFMVGYALLQVPAGWAGDRFGPRAVLAAAAAGWAVLTVLTALLPARGPFPAHAVLLATRFLLGLAAPVVSALMIRQGWRAALCWTAVLPLGLAFAWWRHAPAVPPPAARARGGRSIRPTRSLALLCASYLLESYVQYIFLFWFYLYLVDERGFSLARSGWLTALPYVAATIAMPLAGRASDRATRARGPRAGRAGLALATLAAASALMALGTWLSDPALAVTAIAASIALVLATEGLFWASVADLARESAGAAGGVMNTAENLGGIASTTLVPLVAARAGWSVVFHSAAVLALVSGLVWTVVHFPEARDQEVAG